MRPLTISLSFVILIKEKSLSKEFIIMEKKRARIESEAEKWGCSNVVARKIVGKVRVAEIFPGNR